MSDTDIDQEANVTEQEPPVIEQETTAPEEEAPSRARSGNSVAWIAFLASIIALAAAGYTAWHNWQLSSDTSADDSYARLDSRVSSSASTLSELQAEVTALGERDPGFDAALQSLRRDFDERVRLLDSLPTRMSTIESSVASLAGVSEGARDAWILAESEYYMQIANAQLQLANNPHLASLALKMADERIVQLANPGLTDVRRAISDELATLDVMEKPDIEGASLTLASLSRVVESLPLAATAEADEAADELDPELSGASRAWASVKNATPCSCRPQGLHYCAVSNRSSSRRSTIPAPCSRLTLTRTARRSPARSRRSTRFACTCLLLKCRISPSHCACCGNIAR
jgi:uncharacterized protein HemX